MPNIDENSFDLITSQFVGRFNNTSPMLLDTFYGRNTTFKQNANLFPDKLSNLQQRVVRLALFNYKPYTVWEEVVSVGNGYIVSASYACFKIVPTLCYIKLLLLCLVC